MKTRIILLLVVLLGLCGCSSQQPTTRFGEELIIVDDIEMPSALGEPQLSKQDLESLGSLSDSKRQEKINTYADAVRYLNNSNNQDSKTIIDKIGLYINGDYDDVKIINVFSDSSLYYLLGIKANNKYYLLDPYTSLQGNKEWLYDINIDSSSFSSIESLTESLKNACCDEDDFVFTTDIGQSLDISEKSNELFYSFMDTTFPLALGLPQLSEEKINSIDESNAEYMLTNIADFYAYAKKSRIAGNPIELVELAINYLFGDYTEVGEISILYESSNDSIMYIKANNKYYPLHIFGQYMSGNNVFYSDQQTDCSFKNIDDVQKTVDVLFSNTPNGKVKEILVSSFSCIGYLTGPNGEKMAITDLNGEQEYKFKDYFFLTSYGVPQLNNQDIEDLIKKMDEGEYETVRNSINTIPDFINLFISCGFKSNKGIVSTSQYTGPNVGHIYYYDEGTTIEGGKMEYTISGVESMIVKEGQCDSTATLFQYFFKDKFDEEGYVLIQCFDSNKVFGYGCHAINYFKTNNKYYLFDPSSFLMGDGARGVYADLWTGSDSIEELAQKLYDSTYPSGEVAALMLLEYDGSLAEGRTFNNKTDPSKNIITLPEGADVKVCYGISYDFHKPMHSTAEDHIIGVQTK